MEFEWLGRPEKATMWDVMTQTISLELGKDLLTMIIPGTTSTLHKVIANRVATRLAPNLPLAILTTQYGTNSRTLADDISALLTPTVTATLNSIDTAVQSALTSLDNTLAQAFNKIRQ